MSRQPRNLSFLKCARCRKDRQKCTPLDRSWPSQRCDRCFKFDYPCSANRTARGQSERFFQALATVGPNENFPEWTSHIVPATSPPINTNFTFTSEFVAPEGSYPSHSQENISNDAQQITPKCAELFGALKQAGFSYQQQLRRAAREPENSSEHLIKFGLAMIMKALIVMLHTIQKDREHCIRIHQMYRKGVENEIADGVPPRKAERISIAHLIVALSEMVEEEEDLSVINFTKSIVNVLREGGRWQELIDAVAAPEILLIDPDHCQKICEKDGDGHESEILSVRSLEKDFHKDYKLIDVAKITKLGGDDVFAKMKELLLMPDLKLKETCQCLSGLLQLLNRLGEVDESFEREDIEDITISEAARPKEGEDSELVFSLGMEIHQRVMEVLWKYDSGAESGIDDLLCKVASLVMAEGERQTKAESEIEGKETSSNDDGTEEIGSNAGGQDRDFDEDFCIQFLNSDAFSSI